MHTALSRITATPFDLQSFAQFDRVFFREFMPKQQCKIVRIQSKTASKGRYQWIYSQSHNTWKMRNAYRDGNGTSGPNLNGRDQ